MKLYFMDYIKDVVIPDTNKRLNAAMNLRNYFRVIGRSFGYGLLLWPLYQGLLFLRSHYPLPERRPPPTSTTSSLGWSLDKYHSCYLLHKYYHILSSIIPFFSTEADMQEGEEQESGKNILSPLCGSVFLMRQSKEWIKIPHFALGRCFSPPQSLTLLGDDYPHKIACG